jgi:hypothetical protein
MISQMSIAWRDDGDHLVVGMQNKTMMSVYVGDLLQAKRERQQEREKEKEKEQGEKVEPA